MCSMFSILVINICPSAVICVALKLQHEWCASGAEHAPYSYPNMWLQAVVRI